MLAPGKKPFNKLDSQTAVTNGHSKQDPTGMQPSQHLVEVENVPTLKVGGTLLVF